MFLSMQTRKKVTGPRGVWTLIRGWGHLLAPGGAPGGPDLLMWGSLNGESRLYHSIGLGVKKTTVALSSVGSGAPLCRFEPPRPSWLVVVLRSNRGRGVAFCPCALPLGLSLARLRAASSVGFLRVTVLFRRG